MHGLLALLLFTSPLQLSMAQTARRLYLGCAESPALASAHASHVCGIGIKLHDGFSVFATNNDGRKGLL